MTDRQIFSDSTAILAKSKTSGRWIKNEIKLHYNWNITVKKFAVFNYNYNEILK